MSAGFLQGDLNKMRRGTAFPTSRKVSLTLDSFDKGINLKFDQALTSMDYARYIQNFSFETGALKEGMGFDSLFSKISSGNELTILENDLKNIGSIERVFYFYKYNQEKLSREDKLIFITSTLEAYYIGLYDTQKQLSKLRNIKFTSIPVGARYRLNGEDVIIFSSETDNMIVWNGEEDAYSVLDAPKISSMAVHYERLFATTTGEKNSIWFSDDLDPTNWTLGLDEAGFIELIDERGALLKVVSFLDYVYIFREYGITRLSAFGDQSQFNVSNLYVSSGKIYPDSVSICGDKIIFLASDGLYRFDGVDTTKILSSIEEGFLNIDNSDAISCYCQSSYFLACNFIDKKSGDYLNTLLEIDAETMKLKNITKGVQIKSLMSFSLGSDNLVVATVKTDKENAFLPSILVKNGQYFGNSLEKTWISQESTLGDLYHKKLLTTISIENSCPLVLTIMSGGREHAFELDETKDVNVINCQIALYKFSFKIQSKAKLANIKNLKFEFKRLERKKL